MVKHKVVLVPFPFDNFSSSKVRPAICLTNPIGEHEHILIAFISSKIPEIILESDIVIETNSEDFQLSGLAVSSVIRVHKMVTIPKMLIKRQMGVLSIELQKKIRQKLDQLFDN